MENAHIKERYIFLLQICEIIFRSKFAMNFWKMPAEQYPRGYCFLNRSSCIFYFYWLQTVDRNTVVRLGRFTYHTSIRKFSFWIMFNASYHYITEEEIKGTETKLKSSKLAMIFCFTELQIGLHGVALFNIPNVMKSSSNLNLLISTNYTTWGWNN